VLSLKCTGRLVGHSIRVIVGFGLVKLNLDFLSTTSRSKRMRSIESKAEKGKAGIGKEKLRKEKCL
jgi:hypothetical protein